MDSSWRLVLSAVNSRNVDAFCLRANCVSFPLETKDDGDVLATRDSTIDLRA